MTGTAISLFTETLSGSEFMEPRVPYTVDVLLKLDISEPVYVEFEQRLDGHTDLDPAVPSTDYDSSNAGNLIYIRPVYDQSQIPMWDAKSAAHSDSGIHIDFIFIIVFLNIILFGVAVLVRNKMFSSLDTEIIEATLENESD